MKLEVVEQSHRYFRSTKDGLMPLLALISCLDPIEAILLKNQEEDHVRDYLIEEF